MTEREIERTSPPELADLSAGFWAEAEVIVPPPKQAISLRVDQDVLDWFKQQGPRYQTRMNAVLRTYVSRARSTGKDARTRRSTDERESDGSPRRTSGKRHAAARASLTP